MLDLRPEELASVRAILRAHLPDTRVWAFGSRVGGAAKRYSDLDLAIVSDGHLPMSKLGELAEAFSESDLPFRTDVVDLSTVGPEFRAVILREHEPIQD